MEGLGLFLLIMVVIFVGGWILETVTDGIVAGLFALIAAPFKMFKKKQEKDKINTYINGLYFETVTPSDQLHAALSAHFHKGEFHPANRVVVQHEEPGRYLIGFAWDQDVRFELEDGSSARGSGDPVVVAELTYDASGARTVGRMRLTKFAMDRDWTDEALMENALPWCFAPVAELDPAARLNKNAPLNIASPQTLPLSGPPLEPPAPGPRPIQQPQQPPRLARPTIAPTVSPLSTPRNGAAVGGRFNVPPGWPLPATGWTPPPGWVPDPSWPPAPAGWQFWS